MSFENTLCPCGDTKPTDTMLCDACVDHFKDRRELREYQDARLRVDYRRSAAIILLTLARRRKKQVVCAGNGESSHAGPVTPGLG